MKTVTKATKITTAQVKSVMNFSVKNRANWLKLVDTLDREQLVLLVAAYERAKISNSLWAQDVMDRKGTIALGTGIVHGEKFNFQFN